MRVYLQKRPITFRQKHLFTDIVAMPKKYAVDNIFEITANGFKNLKNQWRKSLNL